MFVLASPAGYHPAQYAAPTQPVVAYQTNATYPVGTVPVQNQYIQGQSVPGPPAGVPATTGAVTVPPVLPPRYKEDHNNAI